MARPKKPTYEYIEKLKLYRKRVKDTDGKYFALYGKTPDELTKKIDEAQAQISARQVAKASPTVELYAREWLALYTAEMTPATAKDYTNAVNVHIVPQLGGMRLRDVTQDDAKRVLLNMSAKSDTMQRKTLNTMRKIFEAAVENGLAEKNPCTKLKAGGKKADEKVPLSKAQVATLLDAVSGTNAETFIMVALCSGLRREEILGLRWDCVSLDENAPHIAVKRALRWEKCRPIVSDELKSTAAKRNVPIPPQLVEHLKPRMGAPDAYVIGGTPLSRQQFYNLWRLVERRKTGEITYRRSDAPKGEDKKVTIVREKGAKSTSGSFCYTIDFDVTPHILRHTYITNLLLAGVNLKTVQYLAGHSNPEVTMKIYVHLTENRPEDLIDKINSAFGAP